MGEWRLKGQFKKTVETVGYQAPGSQRINLEN